LEHLKGSFLGFTRKHKTKFEMLAREKYPSLLRKFVNYGCKNFCTIIHNTVIMMNNFLWDNSTINVTAVINTLIEN
jgi:hypothetical protein